MATHFFPSSGSAYDACQTGKHYCFDGDYDVETGDILVIESEKVIGIADTWPVAVTQTNGNLHRPADDWTLYACMQGRMPNADDIINAAKDLAAQRGWPVRD